MEKLCGELKRTVPHTGPGDAGGVGRGAASGSQEPWYFCVEVFSVISVPERSRESSAQHHRMVDTKILTHRDTD